VDKYVPVRVGASELERIEIKQSSDALIQNYDHKGNETRQEYFQMSKIDSLIM
jgi:hypothetical protein